MSVCHSASLVVEGDRLCYYGPQRAQWQAPLAAIRLCGEFHFSALEFGHYLAIVVDDSGAWLQSPASAIGAAQTLATLSNYWNAPLELQLQAYRGRFASRVLWPARFAGEPLFEIQDDRLALRAL
jgi:hypothetical protein